MKYLLSLLFAIGLINAFAQNDVNPDNGKIDFTKFWTNSISMPEIEKTVSPGFVINDIKVFDKRFDTSTLGFMQKGYPDTRRLLKLKNGDINDIRAYLLGSITPHASPADTTGYVLVCVIKKLWLSDEIYTAEEEKHLPLTRARESGILFRSEFLAYKNGVYIPLYRFDTTLTSEENVYKSGGDYLANAFSLSLQKLASFNSTKIETSKSKYNWQQVEDFNAQRFNIPILTGVPSKGVYLTLQEFKNNEPSIKKFIIKPDKRTDDVFIVDSHGTETLLRNFFACSDGTDIYLKSAGNLFKLYRMNNTFNLFGAKSLSRAGMYIPVGVPLITAPATGKMVTPMRNSKYKINHHPYQLDMETGIIY